MSGVLRNIQAELQRKGTKGEAALKAALSSAAQLKEKGQSAFSSVAKSPDSGSYLGPKASPVKPGK